MNRPLLVIDGDSFAHRAFHGLPRSIRRTGNRGGGAIVGFANFLLRLFEIEQPRAVLVGWDTLTRQITGSVSSRPTKAVGFSTRNCLISCRSCQRLSLRVASRTQRPQVTRRTTFSPQPSPKRNVSAALCS
jgi:hypothetical protein